jgi:AraC family transcriptional regulator
MSNLTQMTDAIDFIETHLQEPIAVADMAQAVGYSVYHFCRTFNQATHHTPYDYLMRRRLAEAAQTLLGSERRVIDVAFDYQFSGPETFARAFRRVYGQQPTQVRKRGWIDPRRRMPRLTAAHIAHIHKGTYLPEIEERGTLRLAGLMTPLRGERAALPALWDWLARELERCEESVLPEKQVGLVHYPRCWEKYGVAYMAAIEVREDPPARASLAVKTLPPQRYARFVHRGSTQDLDLTLDYIYHTWLPKSGHDPCPPYILERYGRGYHAARTGEGETAICVPLGPSDG